MSRKINIAIDGLSGCGKSTLARQLADKLGYIYIDTGAMYRAVTWWVLKNKISPADSRAVIEALDSMNMEFNTLNGANVLYLNGQPLINELIQPAITAQVSHIAIIPEVRKKLVALQQIMARSKGVVMEGRDIGTVVMPNAELKIFVVCSDLVRAKRRVQELQNKNISSDIDQVLLNLKERDKIDSTRETGPLKQAEDAILLDNSEFDREGQLKYVLNLVDKITCIHEAT